MILFDSLLPSLFAPHRGPALLAQRDSVRRHCRMLVELLACVRVERVDFVGPEDSHRDMVKVRFPLVQDEVGWPPVGSEGLWAEPLGGDHYRINNTPWFTRNLSADDVVEAVADDEGLLWAIRRVSHGGRLTIRVIPLREGPLQESLEEVLGAFKALDVTGESAAPAYRIVALDIGPEADLAAVKARLRRGEADGSWACEEGCITDAWHTA